ncbi:type II toxin-antitoxin system mRNA interferase toxin, RelE/StbE family [Pseudomonas sp. CBZ-4]|uniref:type II toxin-antitoxin system RelE/ParE family toxin n=1 Tax=Pseudomonas sp. CBZ-4 TaxID=1163065 RepID=UPI0003451F32|nr:type II toxin-antitoxin system mRNA interferase toxin, RelE/StbE family [Pseudomonas sp. CBZ-4]
MKLEWSPWALKDRDAIFDFIEQDNPRAAIEIDIRIEDQTQRLAHFPESGRVGRCAGTRELVIGRTPYIAAYRIHDNRVRILRVLHEAQSWPEDLPTLIGR